MEFPQLKTWLRLTGDKEDISIYDVKFYPYLDPGEDPVFAAVGGREVYVCRPGATKDAALQILSVLQDPNEDVLFNSVAWSQDFDTGDPLVCVAGSKSKKIRILNVVTGQLVRVLNGHGGDVNDLVTSPRSPHVLTSCSGDYTIRIWNLNPKVQRQPCAAILSGEGHRQAILSIAFHSNGKWLLSGGQDTMVCLWSVPDNLEKSAGSDKPTQVYYPHFASIDIHSDYVDCVRFWGDLILSRAATANINVKRGDIILWKIEGFSSTNDNPPTAPMPAQGRHTRSAFGGRFQRLLTFDMMHVDPFYMRFSLFDMPGHRPILAMANMKARYSFWDLQSLEEGYDAATAEDVAAAASKKRKRSVAEHMLGVARPAGSNDVSNSSARASKGSSPAFERKFNISRPYTALTAHKMTIVQSPVDFTTRAIAWSYDGKWCVGVGDHGMLAIFGRGQK